MRLRLFMLLAAFSAMQVAMFAQDQPSLDTKIAGTVDTVDTSAYKMFEPGDSLLNLSAGAWFGLGFFNPVTSQFQSSNLKPGFYIGLSYLRFISNSWALGGEIAGAFLTSVAERNLYLIPIAAKAAYAIDIKTFFITPSVAVGMAISSLSDIRHLDPYINLGSGFAWRPNLNASYSIRLGVSAIPQSYADSAQNRTGFFMDAAVSATYHL